MLNIAKHSETYPYLVVRAMPAVYLIKYPADPSLSREELVEWGKGQAQRHQRHVCVVFAPDDCAYIKLEGEVENSMIPPFGGIVIYSNEE